MQSDLRQTNVTDADLAVFLRKNSCCIRSTKYNITNYFKMRLSQAAMFARQGNITKDLVYGVTDNTHVLLLEKSQANRLILIKQMDDESPANLVGIIQIINLIIDLDVHQYGSFQGYTFIIDLPGKLELLYEKKSLSQLERFVNYLNKGSAIHLRAIYIHAKEMSNETKSTVDSVIRNKFKESYHPVHFYSSSKDVFALLGKKAFPIEMGGKAQLIKVMQKDCNEKLLRQKQYFLQLEKRISCYKSDRAHWNHGELRDLQNNIETRRDELQRLEKKFKELQEYVRDSAIKIQAWWRSIMVRRKLGTVAL